MDQMKWEENTRQDISFILPLILREKVKKSGHALKNYLLSDCDLNENTVQQLKKQEQEKGIKWC